MEKLLKKFFRDNIFILFYLLVFMIHNLYGSAKIVITRVWCNNDYFGVDGFEIQNIGDTATNLNGWAVSDGDGTDSPFTTSDLTIRPGEIAIILNSGGGNENDTTGIGTNYIWDLTENFGGLDQTVESVAVGKGTSANKFSGFTIKDALLYNDKYTNADDDAASVVAQGQWGPDDAATNHFCKSNKNVIIRTNFSDSNTKNDWKAITAATYPIGCTFWGYITIDKSVYYGTNNICKVFLRDLDLTGASQNIDVKSTSDTNGIQVTLNLKSTSIYTGSFGFTKGASGAGKIKVSNGDIFYVKYLDANDHDTNTANDVKSRSAIWYEFIPPTISSQQANPNIVLNDGIATTLLSAKISNAGNGIGNVYIDLSPIRLSSNQTLYDDGTHGDVTANDNIYSYQTAVPTNSSKGLKILKVYAYESNNTVYNTADITLTVGGIARSVVISEVMVDGLTSNNDEFVELYNPTSSPINLSGYRLTRKSYTGTENNLVSSFPSITIPSYGFLLISPTNFPGGGSVARDIDYTTHERMSGGSYGGSVILYDSGGNVVDKLGYKGTGATTGVCADYEGNPVPVPPGPAPNGGSYERKAKGTSTVTTMTGSGIDSQKGNAWDTDNNNADFILRPASQPQNSSSPIEEPFDKIIISKSDISSSTNYPKYSNITVLAFSPVNTTTSNIVSIKIANLGTMAFDTDISNIKLWYDNNNKFWDNADTFIANGTYSAGLYNFNILNIKSGTNLVLTIDLKSSVRNLRTFKAMIPSGGIRSIDNITNKTAITNLYPQISKRVAPAIISVTTNIDNGSDAVTNNGTDTWDLNATVTENSNSGVIVFADLTSINSGIKLMTNYGGNNYSLSNLIVPVTAKRGIKNIIVLAYDATTNLVTKKTTQIRVEGNEPPLITSFNIQPGTNIIKNSKTNYFSGTSKITQITFVISAADDTGITNVSVMFTNESKTNSIKLSLISGTTLNGSWRGNLNITNNISIGNHTTIVFSFDNKGGIGITNRNINFIANDKPTANAGVDKTVLGGSLVQLQGIGNDTIGGIASYKWSIISNSTGESITLSNPNIQNPTFKAPNVDGYVKFQLIVTDIYEDESAPSFVTIRINRTIPASLTEVKLENNPILDNKITLNNIPKNTKVTIFDITGNKIDEFEATSDSGIIEHKFSPNLASGVYLVLLKDDKGNKRVLKIVIVR
jgi:hypothetical protein